MRAVINESHSCLPECRTSERRREADRRSTRTASNRRGGTSWDRERSQGLGRRKRGAMHRAPPESSIESISFDGVKRTGSMCRVEMENPAGGKLAWTKTYPIGLDVHKKTSPSCQGPRPSAPATRPGQSHSSRARRPGPGNRAALERGLEGALFRGWVYDQQQPHSRRLDVDHPLMRMEYGKPSRLVTTSLDTKVLKVLAFRRGRFVY